MSQQSHDPLYNTDDTTVVDSGTYNAIESSVRPKLLYGVFQNSGLVVTDNHIDNTTIKL